MTGLAAVHDAVDRGEWNAALDALASVGAESHSAEGLELRARAEYGHGDFEASISAWEDLEALLVSERDPVGAARAAAMVAMFLMIDTGLMAPVRTWLRRAERLLEGHDEAPAHAIIAVVRGYERFMCGDMKAASENAALAIDVGSRLGVAPAVVIARVCRARVTIFSGQVEEGLDQLDEIAVDLMSGVVDPLTTGMMYCELICAAQGMALHDKASEWTDVMEHWRHGAAIGTIGGRCRVHRAEILRISGPCDLAEEEALGACDELRPWMRREFGWPLVELGNIRLRRGDLVGAEEAYISAHERARSPHPGLALLRLEQGDIESAATMIGDAIAHPFDVPWKERPPFGDLRLAPLLDAQVEIAFEAGDADTARLAADALTSIASSYPSRSLAAGAELANARAALLDGQLGQAIHRAAAATAAWADIGAPFEAAVARIVLGEAHRRSDNAKGAHMEWRAAKSTFEAFGAAGWAARAERLLTAVPSNRIQVRAGGSMTATFRCDGDMRTVCFGELTVHVRDLKGFRYLERLLGEPNREFHVLDLVAVEHGTLSTRRPARGEVMMAEAVGAGLPVIDDEARAAYRRRLVEIEDDIDEATRMNDLGRVELAQRDRDYLIAELSGAAGLGGRHRSVGSTSERARTAVTRSVRYALARLDQHHPALAAHLGQCVHTGTYCAYTPDTLTSIVWQL